MKTAALSLGPTLEIYSWQEGTGIYRMILDTEEIANERTNVIQVPELSRQWHGLLTRSGRRRARY